MANKKKMRVECSLHFTRRKGATLIEANFMTAEPGTDLGDAWRRMQLTHKGHTIEVQGARLPGAAGGG